MDDQRPMREEYDFTNSQRGRYAQRYAQGTNLVALEPDLAEDFPDTESVNAALRAYREIRQLVSTTRDG